MGKLFNTKSVFSELNSHLYRYVAAKYFRKYDFIKADDNEDEDIRPTAHILFSVGAEQGENPLEPFQKQSKREKAVDDIMKDILNLDKKIVTEEYARQKGIRNDSRTESVLSERINITPVTKIQTQSDPIFRATLDAIHKMNQIQTEFVKLKNDESVSEKEMEDLKDRYRNVCKRIQKRIDQFKEEIETEFEG